MSNWLIALVLRLFVAVVVFSITFLIARAAYRYIPNGRLKRVLYDRTLRTRYPWRFGLGFLVLAWGGIFLAVWLV